MSTMLDTSFLTRSGSVFGRSFPVNWRLHKYIASANSGNMSWPDLVVSDSVLSLLVTTCSDRASSIPDMRKSVPCQLRSHQEIPRLVSGESLRITHRRLEQLFKLGLIRRCDEGQSYARDLARLRWYGRRDRGRSAAPKRISHLRRGHARGLRPLRLSWRLLRLLLGRHTRLEGHLLRSRLLELLALLARIARVLRLLRLRLLSKALRLARKASKLLLHWASSKARWLGRHSTLKASRLLEWLLLLLAVLRLPRSGAIAAP
jgi:hypothetical protein